MSYVKNGHQRDMCYNEIGLFGQYIDIVVGPTAKTAGKGLYDSSLRGRERESL